MCLRRGGHNQREKQSLQAEWHCIASSSRLWVCPPTRNNSLELGCSQNWTPRETPSYAGKEQVGKVVARRRRVLFSMWGCYSVCATSHSHENQSQGPSCQPSSPKVTSMKQSQSARGETLRKKKSEKTQPDSSDILLRAPCRFHK